MTPPTLPIRCPLCALPLAQGERHWQCPNRHGFDVAREGYVNLLPVQHKASMAPGDTAESLAARRAFLDAGHYAPLRAAVVDVLAECRATRVLDVGCGDGAYTEAFVAPGRSVVGLDIAKPAIRIAARRSTAITWLVGSGARLPLDDASVDALTALFTPLHVAEFARVLEPGGTLLVVTPGPQHLAALRARLFDTVQPHQPEKFIASVGPAFTLRAQRDLAFELRLDGPALRQLIAMTPYAWKSRPEARDAALALPGLEVGTAFALLAFERSAG